MASSRKFCLLRRCKSPVSNIKPVRILFASQTGNAQSLAPHERDGIEKLVNGASPFKLAWLSGYLAARGWDGFKQEILPSTALQNRQFPT